MVLEQLDIIVQARIDPALKELKELMPQIKQQMTQAVEVTQKSMEKVDIKRVVNKIQQSIQLVKKKIDNFKKSSKNNEIAVKVNNKDAEKQISQLEKEIDSLQKKINARQMKLDIINPQLDNIVSNTKKEVIPEGVPKNSPVMDNVVNNTLSSNKEFTTLNNQAQKLYTEIEIYNNQLNEAKDKMSQLKGEIQQTSASQSKMVSFFSNFKNKLQEVVTNAGGFKKVFNQIPKATQKISNHIKNIEGSFKTGLNHVLKYAMALFSLRGIYSALSNSARTWLSSQNSAAKQMSSNIEYMKYAMGSAFAPVIQYIINLVYKLMKAIQSVVYALTGVNIFAKVSAKSYNAMANSAKKAKKETQGLADIDEIHNIQKDTGSDNSENGVTAPNIDLSKLNNTPNDIINALKNGDWKELGTVVAKKINQAMYNIPWEKIQDGARQIARGLANFLNGFIGTLDWQEIGNTFAQGINTIIYFGLEFVTTFDWVQFGKAIGKYVNGLFKNVDWKTAGKTFGDGIKGILNSISSYLQEVDWGQIAKSIETFLANVDWTGIATSLFTALGSSLGGIASFIGQLLIDAWAGIKEYFKYWIDEAHKEGASVVEGILVGILNEILAIGEWIYNNICLPFINGFKQAFGIHSPSTVMQEQGSYIVEGLKNGIKGIWDKVKTIFENLKIKIKKVFDNIKNAISIAMNKVKTTMKNIWNGIWSTIKGIINKILGGVEKFVNGAIKGINKLLSGISNVASTVGSVLGFGPVSLQISTISLPRLAKGNVAYGETLAIFGEYSGAKNNPEITTPQNIMAETFEKVLNKHSNNGETINFTNELKLNSKTLAREIIQDLNNEAKRLGYKPILQRG